MSDAEDQQPTNRQDRRPTNRLGAETSVYLRQHMHNPVDWYPWGLEALERARQEDKPLLVSIGYSACHWCHVMERESFEDPDTAASMNALFVCIKVDREERPDIDQIYMDAVMRFVGHGGWPLTVFCKPGGEPFYGGTYFPPVSRHGMPAFRDLLDRVSNAYRLRRGDVDDTAAKLLAALEQRHTGQTDQQPGAKTVAEAARQLIASADRVNGGFGDAPKFPTPTSLELLLSAADVLPGAEARDVVSHVAFTCHAMARGGVYDHVGGAFHRYSVDGRWDVPHFEKMLYDEGQLLRVYAETWRRTGEQDENLLWPIRETVEFLRREMTAPDGGFYASLDADSEGVEGKFYVWTPRQTEVVLGADRAAAFDAAYGVTADGNFEDQASVLRAVGDQPRGHFAAEREALRHARESRIAPGTDPKRLAAWNGLAISGLARAGSLIGDESMLADAAAAADFVLTRMLGPDGVLCRVFDGGRAAGPAFLDDLAAMLEACLDLQRAGAGERYLQAASQFADDIAKRFYDPGERDLFLTPNDGEALVHRPRSDPDGATPHSTGLAALGLVRMATLAGRDDLREVVEALMETHAFALERAPQAFPTLARAALAAERGISVAVILGPPESPASRALADRARRVLLPEDAVVVIAPDAPAPTGVDPHWISGRKPVEGRATAFVCRGLECSLPIVSADELTSLG